MVKWTSTQLDMQKPEKCLSELLSGFLAPRVKFQVKKPLFTEQLATSPIKNSNNVHCITSYIIHKQTYAKTKQRVQPVADVSVQRLRVREKIRRKCILH